MSLDFGRCPISDLTAHSPRMVNQRSLCTHTRLNAMLPCIWNASMPYNVTCIISNLWLLIFIHHINMSKAYIDINSFHTLHVIQLPNNNTQKSLELGPQSNEVSSGLNIQNKKQNKISFFFKIMSLSRQRTPVTTSMSRSERGRVRPSSRLSTCASCRTTLSSVSCILCPRLDVSHTRAVRRADRPSWLGCNLENLVMTRLFRDPKKKISFLHSFELCI